MFILLAADNSTARLVEPNDCMRFHLTIRDLSDEAAQQLLQVDSVGRIADAETAWINVAAVRKLAEDQVPADWSERFQNMLDYAASKGWLNADGTAIQAHIERE